MKVENYTVKKEISFAEKAYITKLIADGYFQKDEDTNTIEYAPYLKEHLEVIAFINMFTEGLTFDENEDKYTSFMSNEEVVDSYYSALENNRCFKEILEDVKEVVEFKKHQYASKSSLDTLLEEITSIVRKFGNGLDLATITEFAKKFNESGLNAKGLVDEYMNSDAHKSKEQEVIDAKNKQIKALVESMPKDHKQPKKTTKKSQNRTKKTDIVEGKVENIEDFSKKMNPPVEE